MKQNLLNYIECPLCREELDLMGVENTGNEIKTGLLICKKDNNHVFPIIDEIPRLLEGAVNQYVPEFLKLKDQLPDNIQSLLEKKRQLDKKYQHIQKSFSSEWEEVGDSVRAWGRSVEGRKKSFLEWVDMDESYLEGKKILDAGCGNGEVELALGNSGAEIFATDISFSVDKVWRKIKNNNLQDQYHVVQANIHQLPYKKNVFDIIHSAGVLHHTPDTLFGFENISRSLKQNGKGYIEVYSTDHKNFVEMMVYYIDRPIRIVTSRLPHTVLHLICYLFAPFQWLVMKILSLFQRNRYIPRTFKELELSLFDNYSPYYQFHHTTEEVFGWYKKLGYTSVKKTLASHNIIGIVGIKQ